jgi:flagellar hook assembly protein FlgD
VGDAPRALEIGLPRPNPGRSIVRLEFGVPAEQSGAAIEVAIFDLAGRRVRTLTRGTARAGRGSLSWDLRDARGAPAPSGVYLVRLAAGPRALTRKVVVLR